MRVLLLSALCLLSRGAEGSVCLDSSIGVTVCWSHVGEKVHFLLQSPSEGWVGLGIPDGGGMAGADIAVVEKDPNGDRVVNDYHSLQPTGPPLPDTCQDWELISFNVSNGKMNAEIARSLVTPDHQDRPIDVNTTMDFIVAYGSTPVVSYHSTARNTMRIPFTGENASLSQHFEGDPDVITYDLKIRGYPISPLGTDGVGTTYADFCFDLSGLDEMHIVGLEQLVPDDVVDYVHHAGVSTYEGNTGCHEKTPDGAKDPNPNIYTWAGHPHNAAFKLPEDVGIAVGGGKAAMDTVLQGAASPEEKVHVLTLNSPQDAAALGTALGQLETGFANNGANPVVGPQENCSTDFWNNVCGSGNVKFTLEYCFGTCWGKWVMGGNCEGCVYGTVDYFSCLPCYGREASLGALEKDMLMTCNLETLTLKDGQGNWQPKVPVYGWSQGLWYSPLNGGDSWQRISYPVEVYCKRSPTTTVNVITVADKSELQTRWNLGYLDAVIGCQTSQGDPCFQPVVGMEGFGYNLLEKCGETTWPPSWVDTVQYPLLITCGSPIYRASPKMRQLGRAQSLRMAMHYDNRLGKLNLFDNSSALRLFLAKTPRKHEAAFLQVGDVKVQGLPGFGNLLPGLSRDVYHCPELGCNGLWGDTQEVTVFFSLMHMHETGRMMTVDVRRGVDEVVHSDKLDYYDFNWQGQRKPKPFTLKRGDRTRVDCVFEVGAGKEVPYGLGSSEEMCIWFMGYYPRIRDIPGVGTGTICAPSPSGQWEGFCGSNSTNASTRHVLNSAADLDSNDKAMGTARTFGVAPETCATKSPSQSPSMSPSVSVQPAPTKSPLPPNSPTQSPLASMSPSTPSSLVDAGPPTQSPSTADALRNTGLMENSQGDNDSSAWWIPVVICVPVLIAGGGISVWLFARKSKQVEFKDNADQTSQVSMSQHSPYGNLEPKVLHPQQVRIISSSEETPNTSV